MCTVSSEIYKETNYEPTQTNNGNVISKFKFRYPNNKENLIIGKTDTDGDLDVQRPRWDAIQIEHSVATELKLVGLQVWRGALLLADYLFANRNEFAGKTLMELGAGVGLTSIAAAVHNSGQIYCTDVDLGEILALIRANVKRNLPLMTGKVTVLEYNFLERPEEYSKDLLAAIDASDIVLAADVIYDDTLTDAFVGVIDAIFTRARPSGKPKTIYMALEKRYVFTFEDCESVAPMYEYFLRQTVHKPWRLQNVPLDFPQFFDYDRCKQLVLLRITSS